MRQPWKIYDFHYYDMKAELSNCFCPLVYKDWDQMCLKKKKKTEKKEKKGLALAVALNKAVWFPLSFSLSLSGKDDMKVF